jgi:Flp pilus assembly protein CpaB
MRASTLFALTVAILLGLASAVTLKVTGFFDKPGATQQVAEPKRPDVNVLVSGRNLFKGNLIDAPWVGVRPLRADEMKHYEVHKEDYLPATPAAVTFRVAAKNIEADKPILRSDLEELALPGKLSERLQPNTRAVNVAVMKDESAGGLIQVGEWVDVMLTTTVQHNDGDAVTKTAGIAHQLRVVAKRNGLYNVFAPLPDDKPVNYTLEANPYRAALIEYCKTKGTLSLEPVPASDQKALEEVRKAAFADMDKGFQQVSYKAPFPANSVEYQDEETRIDSVIKGDMNLGTSDLVRIFGIRTTPPPAAPTEIDQISGTSRLSPARFGANDKPLDPPTHPAGTPAVPIFRAQIQDIQFNTPDAPPKKCKTCGKKKQ